MGSEGVFNLVVVAYYLNVFLYHFVRLDFNSDCRDYSVVAKREPRSKDFQQKIVYAGHLNDERSVVTEKADVYEGVVLGV